MSKYLLIVLAVGCHGGGAAQPDASMPDAPDAMVRPIDAAVDAPQLVRVSGHVDYNGSLPGVMVMALGSAPQSTITDMNGDFYFDVVQGSRLIMEATPSSASGLIPMIRGVIAEDHLRVRIFYLMGPSDVAAANGLGKSFDNGAAIVETDFRNAAIGGYGATLTSGGQVMSPPFGIVYDASGNAVLGEQTVTGGNGSTLLLGGLPAASAVSFTPLVPTAATLPCHPDDADPLPLVGGVTTWFDFECGTGTD